MSSFTVHGRPVPCKRVTHRSTWTKSYQKYMKYKDDVKQAFLDALIKPYGDCKLSVSVIVYLSGGGLYKMGRDGDVDNYIKSALDGLNKVAFDDDRQVMHVTGEKVLCKSGDDRMEISIITIQESESDI